MIPRRAAHPQQSQLLVRRTRMDIITPQRFVAMGGAPSLFPAGGGRAAHSAGGGSLDLWPVGEAYTRLVVQT